MFDLSVPAALRKRLQSVVEQPAKIKYEGYEPIEKRAHHRLFGFLSERLGMLALAGAMALGMTFAPGTAEAKSHHHHHHHHHHSHHHSHHHQSQHHAQKDVKKSVDAAIQRDREYFEAFYKNTFDNEGGRQFTINIRGKGKARVFQSYVADMDVVEDDTGWLLANKRNKTMYHLERQDYESDNAIITNSGIELSHLKRHGSRMNLADIQRLTGDINATIFNFDPKPIYKENYWNSGLSTLDKNLALVLADIGFHQGSDVRDAMLARVVHEVGNGYEINPRAGLSKNDFAVLRGMDPKVLTIGMHYAAGERLADLSQSKANKKYARGWQHRVETYAALAGEGAAEAWLAAKQNTDSAKELFLADNNIILCYH